MPLNDDSVAITLKALLAVIISNPTINYDRRDLLRSSAEMLTWWAQSRASFSICRRGLVASPVTSFTTAAATVNSCEGWSTALECRNRLYAKLLLVFAAFETVDRLWVNTGSQSNRHHIHLNCQSYQPWHWCQTDYFNVDDSIDDVVKCYSSSSAASYYYFYVWWSISIAFSYWRCCVHDADAEQHHYLSWQASEYGC